MRIRPTNGGTTAARSTLALALLLAASFPSPVRGQFIEDTPPELQGPVSCSGAAWGDYDGDGDLDVYFANSTGPNTLLRNDAPAGFTDVTPPELSFVPGLSQGAGWADFDQDGDLDLYVVEENGANKLLRNLGGDAFEPLVASPADPGAGSCFAWLDADANGFIDIYLGKTLEPNVLHRNQDGAQFVADSAGPLGDAGTAGGIAPGDYDGDGDTDLYLSNIGEPNRLLRNDGGAFTDVTPPALIGAGPTASATWVDFDGDLDLDLSIASFFAPNQLLRNDGPAGFVDVAPGTLLASAASSFTAQWADFDNDGDLDVHILNHLSPSVLLRNDAGAFVDVTGAEAAAGSLSTDAVWLDLERDGDLDLYVVNGGGANRYFRNESANGNHWLHVALRGRRSNGSAIGARVIATAGGVSRLRVVEGTNGFHSQGSLDVEFGLGAATAVDSLEIRWPSGIVQTVVPAAVDIRIEIDEPPLFIRGDANSDGAFDLADAIATLGALFGPGLLPCEAAGDSNADGAVNIADAVSTLSALFAGGPLPAPPFPACGIEPAAGTLACTDSPGCP